MEIYEKIHKYILAEQLLTPGQKVIIGVSGGADSLCLLDVLVNLGYPTTVAYFDHQLRESSAADGKYVAQVADRYQAGFVSDRGNPSEMAKQGISLEEASRSLRYRFFFRIAIELETHVVAVAHTLNDQVETLVMNFLRGSGPDGLRGMLPERTLSQFAPVGETAQVHLVRPLLEITKIEAVRHCEQLGLVTIQDSSNLDLGFLRNRIRHDLVPVLETYNPNLSSTLLRMANVMQEEGAYLEGVVRENEVNLEITRSPGEIAFNRLAFSQLHHAIQRRFIRKVLAEIDPEYRQMNFEVIERGIASMLVPQSWAQMDWISDWKLTISPDRILIHQAENQSIFEQFPHVNDAHVRVSQNDGEVSLNGYWRIRLTSQNCTSELRETIQQNEDETLAYLDETLFRNGGIIRSTRRGDRFQPLGMDGTTKLSDFFINRKIPKQVRQSWPLLVIQDQIEWVVGLRVAETARVTETTERVLSCKLFKTRDNQDGA